MKIAHITIFPRYSQSVFKKVENKARVARENGLDMDFYLLNPDVEKFEENLFIVKKSPSFIQTAFLKKIWFRLFKFSYLKQAVPLQNYDAVILRYPLVDGFGSVGFAKEYGKKIFTEHHSDEVAELFGIGRLQDRARAYWEIFYAKRFLVHVKGIIGVTDEIRKVELNKIAPAKSLSFVIANGFDVKSVNFRGFCPFNNESLNVIFVASEFAPWHGLEPLLGAISCYDGDIYLNLALVGEVSELQKELIVRVEKPNIRIEVMGKRYDKELEELMRRATFAISSLALSKKNMKEACTLKSREYIARGLPFVYAYKDTDLDGNEIFAKRFEEGMLKAEDLIKFAREITLKKDEVEQAMKDFAKKIDWRCKLRQMCEVVSKNG